MTVTQIKNAARQDIFVRLTFDGAFKRSRIYKQNVSNADRKEFREYVAQLLSKTISKIQKHRIYTDILHYKTIKSFSDDITQKYARILNRNSLRIGNAQKFINLYWKICWLLQPKITIPIHCPFDSIVIKHLGYDVQKIAWTKFHSIDDYIKLVKAAKKQAGSKSIAEWELEIYREATKYS